MKIEIDEDIFNPVYLPYLSSRADYNIFWGGSGSGKSQFLAQKHLIKCMREDYYRLIFARKHSTDIKDSQFLLFKDIIRQWNIEKFFNIKESTMDIECINGNLMLSHGADNPEKLKSISEPTDAWLEEATEFEESDFNQFDLRLRSERANIEFDLSFNPIDETNWIKKRLFPDQPDYEKEFQIVKEFEINNNIHKLTFRFLHTTYKDNKFISPTYIAKILEKAYDENLQRVYEYGKWGRVVTGGEFYSAFKYATHVNQVEHNSNCVYHISFDQNVVPYITGIVTQICQEDGIFYLNVIDEFCLENPFNNTESLCRKIIEHYSDSLYGMFYYGDASGKKRDTRSRENDYDIISRMFGKYLHNSSNRVPYSNPSLSKRRNFINRILSNQLPIRIVINPRCKYLIADMENVKEDSDGTKLKLTVKNKLTGQTYEKYGHTSDALDYLLCSAFKPYFDMI